MCLGVGVGLLGGHAIEVYTHAYFPNGELLERVTVPYTPVEQHLVPIAIFPHYSPPLFPLPPLPTAAQTGVKLAPMHSNVVLPMSPPTLGCSFSKWCRSCSTLAKQWLPNW